jgi:hypothetical protein
MAIPLTLWDAWRSVGDNGLNALGGAALRLVGDAPLRQELASGHFRPLGS